MQPSAAAGRTQRQLEACHSKVTHRTLGDAKNYSRQLERLRCCQRCRSENANADQVKAGGKAGQGIFLGANTCCRVNAIYEELCCIDFAKWRD